MFPTSPIEVLRINKAHRRFDVGDADLWTANQVAALPAPVYTYQVPTLIPWVWPRYRRVTQTAYSADFKRRSPLAAAVLLAMNPEGCAPRVVVAGGAAAAPYYEKGVDADGVDFFAVGGLESEKLWDFAYDFTRTAYNAIMEGHSGCEELGVFLQTLTPSALTLFLVSSPNVSPKVLKLRLIMRAYPSGSAVAHSFDIPSCCTFYDGRTAWSTTLGAYAHRFRVNLVEPAFSSTTYGARLVKYFKRGYALGFVHLAAKALQPEAVLQLPHCTITPRQICGNWVKGDIEAASGVESDHDVKFNYNVVEPDIWDWLEGSKRDARFENLAQLASGGNRFVLVRCTSPEYGYYNGTGGPENWLPFKRWFSQVKRPPTFEEVFSQKKFNATVDEVVQGFYDVSTGSVRVVNLCKYLGMSSQEVAFFVEKFLARVINNPGRTVSVPKAFQPFKDRLVKRYEAAAKASIEWWTDPKLWYEAALYSRIESPAEWYGGVERLDDAPGATYLSSVAQSLYAMLKDQDLSCHELDLAHCALCQESESSTAPNSIVTLSCGHSFHAEPRVKPECRGLYHWMRVRSQCPCCHGGLDNKDCLPVELLFDWPAL